ncbi:hypothetical protein D3C81_1991620 [compost metagenome]
MFRGAADFSGFGNPPPQAVIAISARTFQLAVDHCLSTHQPVLTVIGKVLQLAMPRALLDQVAPRIVAVLLIAPTLDAVVLHLLKLPSVEVEPVGRRVIAELFAANQ